uniref:Uncharacterized protein n=1 Tax=Anguilla anguilla TaxID=7936 RepID=A0A0E9VCS1_ANGAN
MYSVFSCNLFCANFMITAIFDSCCYKKTK